MKECEKCYQKAFGDETMCYYHKKIADGLIDEPEWEVPKVPVDRVKKSHLGIVHNWASFLSEGDPNLYDELYSEGLLGLGKANSYYKGTNDAAFTTFAFMVVRNQMLKYLEKENLRKKHEVLMTDLLTEDEDENPLDFIETVISDDDDNEQKMIMKEDKAEAWVALFNVVGAMNEREVKILIEKILAERPKTQTELAKELGVSQVWVHKLETSILEQLNKYYIKS